MKLFKLFSLVALVLSLTVSAAFAETGKVDSGAVSSMCDRQSFSLKAYQDEFMKQGKSASTENSNHVKEEVSSSTVNAM